MADTTNLLSQFYLKLDGADAPQDLMGALLEVTVESSLHLPDVATLVLHDPRLRWIDDAHLEPGNAVQVAVKAGRSAPVLFDGEIVEIEPDFGLSTQRLVVRAFDRLHRLARGRYVRSFLNMTDGDLVQKIAQEVGLQAQVGPMPQVHPYIFQANETNLAFLQGRAAALGYFLFVEGKTLHCTAPLSEGQPIALHWGETLQEFRPRLTTIDQVTSVTVRGWDPAKRQEILGRVEQGQGTPQIGETRSGGQIVQGAFQVDARALKADRPIRTQAAADRLAQAVADRHASRFIEAEGRCSGHPGLVAGTSLRLSGVGSRFSGHYFVTSATHTYSPHQGYSTQFSISGQHPSTLLSLLTPEQESIPMTGLVIGIVTDNQDPEGQGRVKVKYPWLSGDHASDWARVVVPGGGANRGLQFLPEINDEVLVGFELGDVHYPYILGGLWNGQDAPPKTSDQVVNRGKVQQRIICSRAGHTITFDDSDGGGGITIEAQGNVTLKAQGNLTLEAQGTVDVQGSLINLN